MTIQRDHRLIIRELKRHFGVPMTFQVNVEHDEDIVTGKTATLATTVVIRKGLWCDATIAALFKLSGTPEMGFTKIFKQVIIDRQDIPIESLGLVLDVTNPNLIIVVDDTRYAVRKIEPISTGQILRYFVEGI